MVPAFRFDAWAMGDDSSGAIVDAHSILPLERAPQLGTNCLWHRGRVGRRALRDACYQGGHGRQDEVVSPNGRVGTGEHPMRFMMRWVWRA